MAARRILAAPVLTATASDTAGSIVDVAEHAERDVLGFLDIRDILMNLLATVGEARAVCEESLERRTERLQAAAAQLGAKTLRQVSDFVCGDGNFVHSNQVRLCVCRNRALAQENTRLRLLSGCNALDCICSEVHGQERRMRRWRYVCCSCT